MFRYFVVFLLCVTAGSSFADDGSHSCASNTCKVGEKVITYATKGDPFYACPTKELADYTTLIVGAISAQYQITGKLPNISQITGEPEYLDDSKGANPTRLLLERSRMVAKVKTFDQAVGLCLPGKPKQTVMIMNIPADGTSIWVSDSKAKTSYWMPRSNVDKK